MTTHCQQLLAIIGDNASNNNTMVDSLQRILPVFSGCELRVRCFAYITNLVAKHVLRIFEAAANKLEVEQRELGLDGATRKGRDLPANLLDNEDDNESDEDQRQDDGQVDDKNANAYMVITATWTESDVSEVRRVLSKVRTFV